MLDAIENSTEICGQVKYAPLWAAYSGQRQGAHKLSEWSDFADLFGDNPMFHYRNQKNGLEQWRPLQPDAVRVMHKYIDECWDGVMPTSGLVWPSTKTGAKWGSSYNWQWFAKLDNDGNVIKPSLLFRLGITEEHYRWHDLRDTFVSLLLDAGLAIDDVAFLARHADSSITAKVYRSRDPDGIAAKLKLLTGPSGNDNASSTGPVQREHLPVRRSPS